MASAPYLIFDLHGSRYAVPALAVCEIISLPELTPLPESPFSIAGVINLRGKIVPVMSLNARLGTGGKTCRVSDSVIVLEDASTLTGVIVSEVHRVQSISEGQIEAVPTSSYLGQSEDSAGRFVNGIAKVDDEVVMLLDLENLLRLPEYSMQPEGQEEPILNSALATELSLYSDATPEDKAIFHARAQSLRQPLANEDLADSLPLAVIGLNGEYFGIDLQIIREFSALRVVTPVPCCPGHVVGQMNLRGDILTLVDIRAALNLPLASIGASDAATGKVVVVQTDAFKIGILVDEVFDVMTLQPSEIHAVPSAAQSASEEYLKGTAPCGQKMMSILDLPKILTHGRLTVDEEA